MKSILKIRGKEYEVQGLKKQVETLKSILDKAVLLHQHYKELNGTIENFRSTVLWSPFSPGAEIVDKNGYDKAMEELLAMLPGAKADKFPAIAKKVNQICLAHMPIVDNRKTPEQAKKDLEERDRICAENEAKRQAEADKFHKRFCPVDPVDIRHNAVTLSVTFDDSDMMTDYFHPHASIGCTMLLADVPFRNQTEKLARQVLAKYPELAKLNWTWKTENYSMGHGNYLISEYFDEWDEKAYDGRNSVRIRYEIQFNSYTKKLRPYKDYPGKATEERLNDNMQALSEELQRKVNKPTMSFNEPLNGVEIRFPDKPSKKILDQLHASPFKYHRAKNLWYAKQRPDTIAFAERLTA